MQQLMAVLASLLLGAITPCLAAQRVPDHYQLWVANPLPLGTQETMLLHQVGRQLVAERWDWRTGTGKTYLLPTPEPASKDNVRRYSMAANASGTWIVGASIMLLRPDGKTLSLNPISGTPGRATPNYEASEPPVAVGLDDGSLLVLSKRRDDTTGKALRVSLQGFIFRELKSQQITSAPKFDFGMAAVKLADGRVLMTGGYAAQRQAWLYDPRRDTWEATGNMSVGRMYPALAALPDGRAFVAGSNSLGTASDSNSVRLGVVYGSELWDPRTGRWTPLPSLPLSFALTAHGATGPSAAAMPDGSLVVGGGMHKHVVLLRAQGKSFAPYWTVADAMPGHRISGIVQALGNNEVAVLGGRAPTPSGCCEQRAGGDRISWVRNGEERAQSLSVVRTDAAVAHRGELSFAAGGWESFFLSSQATQASAVAELIDHRSKRVRALPPLPHALLSGRAMWVDDDRIVVKAVAHGASYDHEFRGMDGRSLEATSSGFLAIYSRRRNAWNSADDPRLARAELAGVVNDEAILVGNDAKVWAVALANLGIRELPRLIQTRKGGVSRTLADGRIVVAGGQAEAEVIEAIDADCARLDCPSSYFGYGALKPSRRHEIFNPTVGEWQLSAQSSGAGMGVVIRADGRVVALGLASRTPSPDPDAGSDYWLAEESDRAGTSWRPLPLPAKSENAKAELGAACGRSHSDRICTLLLGEHPSLPEGVVLLVRAKWDSMLSGYFHDLWALADDTGQWVSVARDLTTEQMLTDRILLRRVAGKALYGSLFQPHKVRLWIE